MVNILIDNFTSLIKYQGGTFTQKESTVDHSYNGTIIRVICDMNENNSTVYSVEEIDGMSGENCVFVKKPNPIETKDKAIAPKI